MSAEFNMGESFRYNARDNGMTSRPLRRRTEGNFFPTREEGPGAKEALRDKMIHSFDHLASPRMSGGQGVRIKRVPQDPYSNVQEMIEDMRKNRQVQVGDDWGVDFPSEFSASGNLPGHPIEKAPETPASELREKPTKAADISTDPAKRSQRNHITNRYRQFSASRPTRNY